MRLMGNEYAGAVYVIAATKDGATEYWAAATPRDQAIKAVQEQLAPGWSASMTDRRLDTAQVAELEMRLNSVRKLKR